MSSKERRREIEIEWEAEQGRIEKERNRKNNLSMWERIEELDVNNDLRDILHRLANGERE